MKGITHLSLDLGGDINPAYSNGTERSYNSMLQLTGSKVVSMIAAFLCRELIY